MMVGAAPQKSLRISATRAASSNWKSAWPAPRRLRVRISRGPFEGEGRVGIEGGAAATLQDGLTARRSALNRETLGPNPSPVTQVLHAHRAGSGLQTRDLLGSIPREHVRDAGATADADRFKPG